MLRSVGRSPGWGWRGLTWKINDYFLICVRICWCVRGWRRGDTREDGLLALCGGSVFGDPMQTHLLGSRPAVLTGIATSLRTRPFQGTENPD